MAGASHLYAIAVGSNRPGRHGAPTGAVAAAMSHLDAQIGTVLARSAIMAFPALGPSRRRFANAAVLLQSALAPIELLAALNAIERGFGRRRGRRWGARVLDLDIILWSGGIFAHPRLQVPHPRFRERSFVTEPLAAIVPAWRDPVGGRSMRQIAARLKRAHAVDPARTTP